MNAIPAREESAAAPDAAAHEQAVAAGYRHSHIAWISLFYCANGMAEATSNFILPDTLQRLTHNAFVISIILAMNPFFGLVMFPLAGWHSDRIWTRFGRRRPLILLGAVCLALSGLGLPLAQHQADRLGWLAPALRFFGQPGVAPALALVACWNLIYQAAGDLIAIMSRSFIGDAVPARHRGKAFAISNVATTAAMFLTLWAGGAIARRSEFAWYAIASAIALLVIIPGMFLLRERPGPRPAVENRSGLRDYIATIRETPHFFRMCLVIACTFVSSQLVMNYYRLFTKEQLHLGLDEALKPFSWLPVIALVASYPLGWLADRMSQKHMMLAGAVLLALAGAWAAGAHSIRDLRIVAILLGLGLVAIDIPSSAYLVSLMPAGRIGHLSGFANIFRGGPRMLMFFGAGWLIELFGRNYRLAFVGAVLCAVAAIILLIPLPRSPPDLR